MRDSNPRRCNVVWKVRRRVSTETWRQCSTGCQRSGGTSSRRTGPARPSPSWPTSRRGFVVSEPSARVVADSITQEGHRLTTLEVVMHRFDVEAARGYQAFS